MLRCVRETKPRAIIAENVKGLLRPSFKPYYNYIIRQLKAPYEEPLEGEDWRDHDRRLEKLLGEDDYDPTKRYDVTFRLVNAADYGVPQVRWRVFVVAFRKDLGLEGWEIPDGKYSEAALLHDQAAGVYWKRHGICPARGPRARSSPARRTVTSLGGPSGTLSRNLPAPLEPLEKKLEHPDLLHHFGWPGAREYPGHTPNDLDKPAKTVKAGVHGVPGGETVLRLDDGSTPLYDGPRGGPCHDFPRRQASGRTPGRADAATRQRCPCGTGQVHGQRGRGRPSFVLRPDGNPGRLNWHDLSTSARFRILRSVKARAAGGGQRTQGDGANPGNWLQAAAPFAAAAALSAWAGFRSSAWPDDQLALLQTMMRREYPQVVFDREQPCIEGHVMTGAGSQAVGQVKALGWLLSRHGLMCPASSIRRPPNVDGRSPQKTQLSPQLLSTLSKYVLAYPCGRSPDPLGLRFEVADLLPLGRSPARSSASRVASSSWPSSSISPPLLKPKEIRQPIEPDPFCPRGIEQDTVDVREEHRLFPKSGTRGRVEGGTMRARAVKVRHLRQHARRPALEQPCELWDWLGRQMCGAPAISPMVDPERSGQAQQGLDRHEVGLLHSFGRRPSA